MSDPPPGTHAVSRWLRANALASIGLSVTLVGSVVTAAYIVVHWIDAQEYQIKDINAAMAEHARDIAKFQGALVSIDARLNEHTRADSAMQERLSVIEALSRYAAERASQPPLPTPFVPNRRGSGP